MTRFAFLFLVLGCGHASVQKSSESGAAALERGDQAGAYEAFAKALCDGEQSLDIARNFATAWSGLGRPGDPQAKLAGCDVAPFIRFYLAGIGDLARNDYDNAESAFLSAQENGAPRDEIAMWRGRVALRRTDLARAATLFGDAAAQSPMRVDIRLEWADALAQGGDVQKTRDALTGILGLSPTPKEVSEARRILNRALRAGEPRLTPSAAQAVDDALGAVQRGEISRDLLGRLSPFIQGEAHPRLLVAQGVVLLRLGQIEAGRDALTLAMRLAPNDPDAPRVLAVTLVALDRPTEAYGYLREATLRDPFDAEAARLLASAATDRGEMDVALDARSRLVVLEPQVIENYVWLARTLRERGRLQPAEDIARRGLVMSPNDIPLLLERATILAQSFKVSPSDAQSKAREQTRVAVSDLLRVAPEHPAARPLLESVGL